MMRSWLLWAGSLGISMACGGCAGWHAGGGDRPGQLTAQDLPRFEQAIAPYVKKARETLPDVKRRYQAGLPEGDTLYVTLRLPGGGGRFEQIFVRVEDWYGDDMIGRPAGPMETPGGYAPGETLSFKESAVLDWVITKPDGFEEGNYVGRFLEGYGR